MGHSDRAGAARGRRPDGQRVLYRSRCQSCEDCSPNSPPAVVSALPQLIAKRPVLRCQGPEQHVNCHPTITRRHCGANVQPSGIVPGDRALRLRFLAVYLGDMSLEHSAPCLVLAVVALALGRLGMPVTVMGFRVRVVVVGDVGGRGRRWRRPGGRVRTGGRGWARAGCCRVRARGGRRRHDRGRRRVILRPGQA